MNYALKLQGSTDFLKSVIKINSIGKNYLCAHCLKKHIYSSIRGGRNYASDATQTRHFLKSKQCQGQSNKLGEKIGKKSVTELMKVSNKKSSKTTMKIYQLRASDVKAFAEKPGMTFKKEKAVKTYNYDSTRSYDPSLVVTSENVVKFVESLLNENVSSNVVPENNLKHICDKNSPEETNFKKLSTLPCEKFSQNAPINNLETSSIIQSTNVNYKEVKIDQELNFDSNGKGQHYITSLDNLEYLQPKTLSKSANIGTKESDFIKLFSSYIDVSNTCGMINDVFNQFKAFKNKENVIWAMCIKKGNTTNVYNQLLHAFSNDWTKVEEIREMMKDDNVNCNYQTYAALLESLGRNKDSTNMIHWESKILKIIEEMKDKKMSINGLFINSVVGKNQLKFILKSIHAILPQFEPAPFKMKLNSNCELLQKLNQTQNQLESQVKNLLSSDDLMHLIDEQIAAEKKFFIPVKAIKVNTIEECSAEDKDRYANWKKLWRKEIDAGFRSALKNKNLKKAFAVFNMDVYLKCLPPEVYVDAIMHNIKNLVEYTGNFSPSLRYLYKSLGDQVYQRYLIMRMEKYGILEDTKKMFQRYCEWYAEPSGPAKNCRQQWQSLSQEYFSGCSSGIREIKWPESVKISVGKFLYDIILKRVKFNSKENGKERWIPVFYTILKRDIAMVTEEIKCHPSVGKLFRKCSFDVIHFETTQVPTICPPKPWKSSSHGGYLVASVDFIRAPREILGKKLNLSKVDVQQLYPTCDALNTLQAVPWKVNEPLLDVVLEIFKNGGCDSLDVPEYPNLSVVPLVMTPEMTPEQRMLEHRKRKILIMEKQNKYGLWCEALYRLSLASHFRGKIFWLPQNFDFRGRVYPVPPHLNHIGGDLFRSLLVFAKGKPLGPKGLDWLKIHTINLTGTHKRSSNKDRLNYANEILPEILDSAEKPLTGNRWWSKAEERWQTLAACMEIKKALDSGNPEEYVCCFPVHQDGSCNGLQHYAALGRDCIGAKSVNLTPCDIPQDVYDVVTQLIEKERAKDAQNGVAIAKVLEGFVKRKVVKQTIMTTVYGVTRYGARLQIAGQLEGVSEFPKQHVWLAAGYLTNKAFESLKQMFTSAKEIQDWFIQCAEVICEQREFVQWVSPLGLPILQPYFRRPTKNNSNLRELIKSPNAIKQKNAFPPNFVHSLDSSHMMLTAQYCEQANITFASIHDCFWSHPCSVETMNKICREQFIALHSLPILKDLSNFFLEHYGKNKEVNTKAVEVFSSVPQTGSFDLNDVYNSVYFFS